MFLRSIRLTGCGNVACRWTAECRVVTTSTRDINFEDHIEVFRDKSTWEVVRALTILKLCTVKGITDNSLLLLEYCRSLGVDRVLLKPTFYEQFVGGETASELRACMRKVGAYGMRSMLAATMEEDVGQKKSEDVYNTNCQRILHAIEMASVEAPASPMVQLKLSGLLPANLLVDLGKMYTPPENRLKMVEAIAKGITGNSISSLEDVLGKSHMDSLMGAVERFKRICLKAVARKVKVLVDAECTHLNMGLSVLTLAAVASFNSRSPVIWNTYQCYLKDAQENVSYELRLVKEHLGCHFGAKLVRGAYMVQERSRALQLRIPDPVCDGYEASSLNFNTILSYLLEKVADNSSKCQFIVASHNEESIHFAIQRMAELGIDKKEGSVCFGQLYGMCDQVSNTLAKSAFPVYKSIPYGSLEEVLPYLARRVVENRSVLDRARKEQSLLGKELRQRIRRAVWN